MSKRLLVFFFGLLVYAVLLFTEVYWIGFVGNLFFSRTLDSAPAPGSPLASLLVDLALLSLFGLQHSLMARPSFKQRLARWVPEAAERSVYLLFTSLCLLLMFSQWRPLGGYLWEFKDGLPYYAFMSLYGLGWFIVYWSTFSINHYDFSGLRQVYLFLLGRPYTPVEFKQSFLYRIVRHPMMFGLLIVFWAAPRMSLGHLLLALGMTVYIFIGVLFEERELLRSFGNTYQQYRQEVPMLLPLPRRKPGLV